MVETTRRGDEQALPIMRKHLVFIAFIAIIFLAGTVQAVDLKPYAFPFTGKWNPTDNPLILDEYGFQDIQNMRREGKRIKGVQGHTRINENKINATYYKPRSGFHFTKDAPSESHVIIQAFNVDETSSELYQNKTAIPNSGEFNATTLHSDTSDAGIGRFSIAPSGNVAYANGKESLIWGGDEMNISGFYVYVPGQTPADNWNKVLENDSDTYVSLSGVTTFWIGANRRINKAKLYVNSPNTTASVMTIQEYTLSASGVTPVSGTTVDGTSVAGVALAQTGTISWEYNTDTRASFVEDTDILAYWYKFILSAAMSSGTSVYYVTCGESSFRPVEDMWDGELIAVAKAWHTSSSGTTDITTEVQDDTPSYYADLGTTFGSNTDSLVVGFTQKMRGLALYIDDSHVNTIDTSGVTVYYWSGTIWSQVTAKYDGTTDASGNTSFTRNEGLIHWIPTEETSAQNLETKRTYQSNESLYYMRIVPGVTNMTTGTRIYHIKGIPAQPAKNTTKITTDGANFPVMFQKRLFLFKGNKAIYSALDKPDVFNGEDSGTLVFGGEQKITSAGVIYNVFLATGYEQLIVTKASETYRLHGDGPENWVIDQVDSNVGNVAPLSFAVCNVSDVQEGVKRNVAIWQASHGFVKCDGASVQDVGVDSSGNPLLAVYFDPADSRSIARHRIDNTVSWYDPNTQNYKSLISSGAEVNDEWAAADVWEDAPVQAWGVNWESSVTTHNVELEYSLKYNEFTKLYREDGNGARPLQVGFQTKDSDGKIYTYGASDNGAAYRLENGRTWDGTPITEFVWTKDLMLDDEKSIFNFTAIKNFRLMFTPKSTGLISIAHYGDGAATTSGVSNQATISDLSMAVTSGRNSQDVVLGPFLKHSFKISTTTSDVPNGMELLGMGLWYESFKTWRE